MEHTGSSKRIPFLRHCLSPQNSLLTKLDIAAYGKEEVIEEPSSISQNQAVKNGFVAEKH